MLHISFIYFNLDKSTSINLYFYFYAVYISINLLYVINVYIYVTRKKYIFSFIIDFIDFIYEFIV